MRKWHRGVGMREAIIPTRSLFIYPGYLNVWVLAAMTVETYESSDIVIKRDKIQIELMKKRVGNTC